ncbi:hypothetical protein RSOL_510570, partial [Rhizoctonia solani AG-3 Rhs1AP]
MCQVQILRLRTEIMPAPPPLSAFPRVNGKGQTIVRSTKNTQKKRASAIVALSPRITHAGPTSMDQEQVPPLELAENTTARKRARLSRQPSVPTSLATRASSRQLRNSPLTGDETEVTASQRAATAPITDRELSTTAPVNSGTHRRPGRPRGKKPHALASSSSSSLTPRSASLTTRDARPGPNSAVGVKSEPIDDPLLTHVDPPPEPLDPHVDGMDEIHPNVEPVPTVKIALGRRKGKGKDNVTEGGDHEPDGQNNIKQPPHKYKLETSSKRVNIHNLFDDLMHNLTYESPKVFTLPEDIRTHFKDVATTSAGTYVDSGDVVRERVKFQQSRAADYLLRLLQTPLAYGLPRTTVGRIAGKWAKMDVSKSLGTLYGIRPQLHSKLLPRPEARRVSSSPSSSPLTSLSSLSDHEEEEEGEEDDDLPSIQDDDRQSTDDMAAAQLLHSFHIQVRSASSANSVAGETQPTEHSANTRGSSPLSSILSDDPQDYTRQVPSTSKRNSNVYSLNPPVSRAHTNGIKIIPKAGSFAIRIPASKPVPRPVIRTSPPPKRSVQPHPSPARSEPAPSSLVGITSGVNSKSSKSSGADVDDPTRDSDDLSPAEIAKLKKIKELISIKGEEALMKFLRS